MSMPTMTEEGVPAVMGKATQSSPEPFATGFLQDLHDSEQKKPLSGS